MTHFVVFFCSILGRGQAPKPGSGVITLCYSDFVVDSSQPCRFDFEILNKAAAVCLEKMKKVCFFSSDYLCLTFNKIDCA